MLIFHVYALQLEQLYISIFLNFCLLIKKKKKEEKASLACS